MDATTLHLMNAIHHPWKARMHLANAQLITNATDPFILAYDTIDYDPNGNLTTGAAASYTVPVSGFYIVSAAFALVGCTAGVGDMTIGLVKNGGEYIIQIQRDGIEATNPSRAMTINDLFAAGDVLQITVYQANGANRNTTTGAGQVFFQVHFLSFA